MQRLVPPKKRRLKNTHKPRRGVIIVLFAATLTVLLGMLGLVLDAGLLMATHRQLRNTADAVAMAAAKAKHEGGTDQEVLAVANDILEKNSSSAYTLSLNVGTTDSLNLPPDSGPYAGSSQHIEVYCRTTVNTILVHVLGIEQNHDVTARAVAGWEPVSKGEGAIVLNPSAIPGLSIQGNNTKLLVDGTVLVNSRGEGLDQHGQEVDVDGDGTLSGDTYGIETSVNSSDDASTRIEARFVQLVGGVDNLDAIQYYGNPDGPYPLRARAEIAPDPVRELGIPLPPLDANGVPIQHGSVSFGSGTVATLDPGIYNDIRISNGADVTFSPGIYILMPDGQNKGLTISGAPTVVANDVLIYVGSSTYLDIAGDPGYYDRMDGPLDYSADNNYEMPPSDSGEPSTVVHANVNINATNGDVQMTGLDRPSSEFDNFLFYQRRRNDNTVQIQGKSGTEVNMTGAIYAKWANFKVSGQGRYEAQFIVGSMEISGGATITLNGTGRNFGLANQVFLFE